MKVLRWFQRLFGLAALGLLGYCAFVVADTWRFQNPELSTFGFGLPSAPGVNREMTRGLIGRIEIPMVGISTVLLEGTEATTLRRAAGHITGTGMPGEPGNIGISGHRDTFFRPLRHISIGDVITVKTIGNEYRYRVLSTRIVKPEDVSVLDPNGHEILTLVTCYPFYLVGPAPERFIVRAERLT